MDVRLYSTGSLQRVHFQNLFPLLISTISTPWFQIQLVLMLRLVPPNTDPLMYSLPSIMNLSSGEILLVISECAMACPGSAELSTPSSSMMQVYLLCISMHSKVCINISYGKMVRRWYDLWTLLGCLVVNDQSECTHSESMRKNVRICGKIVASEILDCESIIQIKDDYPGYPGVTRQNLGVGGVPDLKSLGWGRVYPTLPYPR